MTLPAHADQMPRLTRLVIDNFRSIRNCDVKLAPLTVFVGRNGSGKTNFMDALYFLSQISQGNVAQAIEIRGGLDEIVFRAGGRYAQSMTMTFDFDLGSVGEGSYGFKVTAQTGGQFEVATERCEFRVQNATFGFVREGPSPFRVQTSANRPSGSLVTPPTQLALAQLVGQGIYADLSSLLSGLRLYQLSTDAMRQTSGTGYSGPMMNTGVNVASILNELARHDPEALNRIRQYLKAMIPGVESLDPVRVGIHQSLQLLGEPTTQGRAQTFNVNEMSDGTIRALGVLVAVFQTRLNTQQPVRVVAMEEPETGLHPGAAAALMEALSEASSWVQVLISTHSPDLIDKGGVDVDQLRTVALVNGETVIRPVNDAERAAILNHLYSAGELLRMGQLAGDATESELPDREND